jgi:hypothetical protein
VFARGGELREHRLHFGPPGRGRRYHLERRPRLLE